MSAILRQKLVAMAMFLDGSQGDIRIMKLFHTRTNPQNLVKIGPLISEIPRLEVDH